ncbi:MAG: DinB family protein [Chloroflexota bacterium]|nr:DinB family protein [Chloroflexota bacterium]
MTAAGPGAALAPADVAELLESTCALLEAEMKALGDAGCSLHFKTGEWCVNECVGHIIEADRRGFGGRIKDILAGKPLVSWDQAQVARDRRDCQRMSQSIWMEFMGPRHDYITMVRALVTSDLDKSGVHPKVGVLRVRDLLHEWVYHDRNHTRQLLNIQQERVYPHMGNGQKFVGE